MRSGSQHRRTRARRVLGRACRLVDGRRRLAARPGLERLERRQQLCPLRDQLRQLPRPAGQLRLYSASLALQASRLLPVQRRVAGLRRLHPGAVGLGGQRCARSGHSVSARWCHAHSRRRGGSVRTSDGVLEGRLASSASTLDVLLEPSDRAHLLDVVPLREDLGRVLQHRARLLHGVRPLLRARHDPRQSSLLSRQISVESASNRPSNRPSSRSLLTLRSRRVWAGNATAGVT